MLLSSSGFTENDKPIMEVYIKDSSGLSLNSKVRVDGDKVSTEKRYTVGMTNIGAR